MAGSEVPMPTMPTTPIRTDRLDLVAGTLAVVRTELDGREALASILEVEVPDSWPPPLYDQGAMRWILDRLEETRVFETWGFRYFILRRDAAPGLALGAGGFKGPPTAEGTVEIGYSVLPEFQRKGFASEAVRGFLDYAYADPRVTAVVAETLPDLAPSIGVLEKTGFAFEGDGSEPGLIRYRHERA